MEVSSATASSSSANAYAALDSSEFVQILIEELQNQDPLAPSDSSAILEQLSSLRNIESQTLLGEQLSELVRQNQVSAAGNMIGKIVDGLDTTNTNTSGLVTSVRVTDDGVYLELDNGRKMNIDQITNIYDNTDPVETPPDASTPTTPPDNSADDDPEPADPVASATQALIDAAQNILTGNPEPTPSRALTRAAAMLDTSNPNAQTTVSAL